MKRLAAILVVALCLQFPLQAAPPVKSAPLSTNPNATAMVQAHAAVLMDRQTGLVLWSHNPNLPLPMASTTKIMTAMVILDHAGANGEKLDDKVTVSEYAASTGGSSQFGKGDVVTLRDLLKAALIRSSNESTVAAAEYLAGSEAQFVAWMNEKAKTIGCKHTHFVNPHGLYKEQGGLHYSTAYDLGLMARYALTNYPMIREIVTTRYTTVYADPRGPVVLENRDKVLGKPVPGVPGSVVDGVKTGYVKESGKCLVSSATRNGWQLIAVVLDSPDMFKENMDLLHYGFTRFAWKTYATDQQAGAAVKVRWGAPGEVPVGAQGVLGAPVALAASGSTPYRVCFAGEAPKAPVQAGAVLGTLELRRGDKVITAMPAVAMAGARVAWWAHGFLALLFLVVFAVSFMLLELFYGARAKNHRRRRRFQSA